MLSRNTLLLAQRLDFCKPSSAVGSKKKRLVLRSLSESDVLHKILLRRVFRRGAEVAPGRFAYIA